MLSKRLKNSFLTLLIAAGAILLTSAGAHAIPSLQLDIGGGTYDWSTQTIVTTSDTFTLYAYLSVNNWNTTGDTYFISIAIAPAVDEPDGGSYGEFSFTYNDPATITDGGALTRDILVTEDMSHGTAPLDGIVDGMGWSDDLPPHGIFPTYYMELEFKFSGTETAEYDTQDDPGGPIGPCPPDGPCMYYAAFDIDVAWLTSPYGIHFDLYNKNIMGNGKDKTMFAPFSHDAEAVPEPSTILLLGAGMIGLGIIKRRFG